MKKILCALPLAMMLTACVTADGTPTAGMSTATNTSVTVFKVAVAQKCRIELNNRKEWQTISSALSAEKKMDYENQICGCTGDQAAQKLNMFDLTQAAIDPAYRATLISKTVPEAITTCLGQFKP